MLDHIQYEFRFVQNTLADPEPEPKLRYSGSSSGSGFATLQPSSIEQVKSDSYKDQPGKLLIIHRPPIITGTYPMLCTLEE
jgi:hypothetical protein